MSKDKKKEKPVKQEKKASLKTKHRKSDNSRKRAPQHRLNRTLEKFSASCDATRTERGRKEALQHTAVREQGISAAKTGEEMASLLNRTKVKPINPLKLARQFMPNGY